MKEDIEQLYLLLTQQARARFADLQSTIPKKVDKSEWKPAPARRDLELGPIKAGQSHAPTTEVKHNLETEKRQQTARIDENKATDEDKASLRQHAADLEAIIRILIKDKSKKLKPILISVFTKLQAVLESAKPAAATTATTATTATLSTTFNEPKLEDAYSELKQLKGFEIGIITLQTLARIYGAELSPPPYEVLKAIENEVLTPPAHTIGPHSAFLLYR